MDHGGDHEHHVEPDVKDGHIPHLLSCASSFVNCTVAYRNTFLTEYRDEFSLSTHIHR